MSTQTSSQSLRSSQSGMVSMMVTMILMIVLSLVVLGFAQISRRNQRESLDRQLSTQAFYAAETGINDTRNIIKTAVDNGNTVQSKTSCSDTGGGFYNSLNATIDSASKTGYTCVLVDPAPTTLDYADVSDRSIVTPLASQTGQLSSVTFTWKTKSGSGTPANTCPTVAKGVFSSTASWTCGYGVLRFDLVPTGGSSNNLSSLQASQMTTFAIPLKQGSVGSTSIGYGANTANTNNLVGVPCDNTSCKLTITGLGTDSYYLRISSLYQGSSLRITGTTTSGVAKFANAQVMIDATGKAQDTLRRIQVHVPINSSSQNQLPDYVMQSTDSICKRFVAMDGFFDSQAAEPTTTSNPLCQ